VGSGSATLPVLTFKHFSGTSAFLSAALRPLRFPSPFDCDSAALQPLRLQCLLLAVPPLVEGWLNKKVDVQTRIVFF
jgi:hypothetical protein